MSDSKNSKAGSSHQQPGTSKGSTGNSFSRSDEPLGQRLQEGKGYIAPEVLQAYSQKANMIMATPENERMELDTVFLIDYMANVFRAKIAEAEMDVLVRTRATSPKAKPPLPPLRPVHETGSDTIVSTKASGENEHYTGLIESKFSTGPAQQVKLNEMALKPENFDGKAINARAWVNSFERAALANDWTQATMIKYLPSFFTKSATDWFITMCQPSIDKRTSWQWVKNAFVKHYLGEQEYLFHRRRLQTSFQNTNEPLSAFIPRMMLLIEMAYEENKLTEEEKVELMIEKLLPEYQERLALVKPTNVIELNSLGIKLEQGLRAAKAASRRLSDKKPEGKSQQSNKPGFNRKKPVAKDSPVCTRCDRKGHLANKCFSSAKEDGTKLDPATAQPKPPKKKPVNAVANPNEISESKPIVTIKRVCPVSVNKDELIIHPVTMNGIEVMSMLDTGAGISLIDESLAKKYNWPIKKNSISLCGADGNPIVSRGKVAVKIEMRINEIIKEVQMDVVVVSNLCEQALLGIDVLKLLKVTINIGQSSISFEDFRERKMTGIRIPDEITLPPRSENVVDATTDVKGPIMVIPFTFSETIIAANSIANAKDGKIPILLANLENREVVLKNNLQIGTFEILNEDNTTSTVNAVHTLPGCVETVNVGDHLSEKQLRDLNALFSSYIEAFSIGGKIGNTNLISHKIELEPDARPFKEPHRRRPKIHVEETRRQIPEMLASGIIEESSSPFASAYVLVKKKNGEMRLCIDFRRLNNMTKKCSYPLPNIEECLENLSGKSFFSQLDLASGFWQIPVENKSRELTAFRTEDGLFQFRRMPFGLCNAPASFQRMVNALFAGLKGLQLQVFIDDLCVATHTWEEHISLLTQMFKLLLNANLRLKANKCTFGAREVKFLGHVLSAKGIRQDPDKLRAIISLPPPTNVDETRRVLGMMGYYRRFVPNYAAISEPLTKLLKKGVEFVWKPEHKQAFNDLIALLAKNATLTHFQYGKPTLLKTDASKVGVAGILQQRSADNEWKLVVCCSRRLTPAEANYGVSDLEGLAIVHSVTKLRPYLIGTRFTILTDHCALCALNLKEPKSARLARWALILSQFDFTVKYIKGGLHRDVDCLSRAPVHEEVDEYSEQYIQTVNPIYNVNGLVMPVDIDKWADALHDDPNFFELKAKAEEEPDEIKLRNGLLYKDNRLFVPPAMRNMVLQENHENPISNHGGIEATLDRILRRYWWPNVKKDVQEFVSSCHQCLTRKAERQLPSGSMQHHEVIEPMQLVAFDCLGPLPESMTGKKHVILGIDMFSRFVDAKAVKKIDANTFAKFLSSFIGRFGVPEGILTDNATTFINAQISNLAVVFAFKHFRSTPHHSRGNSVAERAIQSLQEKLSLASGELNEWATALPSAVLSLNTTLHTSVGFPPFTLMFGRRPPFNSSVSSHKRNLYDLQAEIIQKTLDDGQAEAIARQSDAQAASRKYFGAKHVERSFNVGDVVLTRRMGRKAKLSSRFVGPYKVCERKNDIYLIESLDDKKTKLSRHIKDLKLYQARKVGMIKLLALTAVLVSTIWLSEEMLVEEVSPVVWKPTHYYVSLGYTTFKLYLILEGNIPLGGHAKPKIN